VVAVLGLCVGSFLNVVIHRLPKMMEAQWRAECAALAGETPAAAEAFNLMHPRSRCPSCAAPITAWQNVPVVSWLALGGKCSACGSRISARYPAVELIAGTLAALAIARFGPTWQGLAACGLLWTLVALTFIDADTQLLPDDITLPLVWAGLAVNLFGLFVPLSESVIGAIAGYLSLWLVYWAFKLVRGDPVAAMRAGGAGNDEVVRRCFGGRFAPQLGALRVPSALEHPRQPMDDDVEEAADDQADHRRDGGRGSGIEQRVDHGGNRNSDRRLSTAQDARCFAPFPAGGERPRREQPARGPTRLRGDRGVVSRR
jgi:prepilin signal peptidase PulO-like enzyme (type II secretory pathway)